MESEDRFEKILHNDYDQSIRINKLGLKMRNAMSNISIKNCILLLYIVTVYSLSTLHKTFYTLHVGMYRIISCVLFLYLAIRINLKMSLSRYLIISMKK